MHAYRTHKCSEIRASHVGETVRVSGWVHKKRDHGDLVFIDLRDHYGIVQIVTEVDGPAFDVIESLRNESVVTVTGKVVVRAPDEVNPILPTGEGKRKKGVEGKRVELRVDIGGCLINKKRINIR